MHLYILNYNNYYNRQVKKFDTLDEYLVADYYNGLNIDGVSFNPSDGVITEQVVNFKPVGDYLICAYIHTGESVETIDSRWFIVQSDRLKTGQYNLQLRRDVIVDNYSKVIDASVFVEKATLPYDSGVLFTNEGMTFNQIKKSETLLKDKTQVPWLVAYYAANLSSNALTLDLQTGQAISIGVPIANWSYYNYTNLSESPQLYKAPYDLCNLSFDINTSVSVSGTTPIRLYRLCNYGFNLFNNNVWNSVININCYYNLNKWNYSGLYGFEDNKTTLQNTLLIPSINNNFSILDSACRAYVGSAIKSDYEYLLSLNGKIIVDSNGKYYKVNIVYNINYDTGDIVPINSGNTANIYASMQLTITNMVNLSSGLLAGSSTTNPFHLRIQGQQLSILLSDVTNDSGVTVNISTTGYKPQSALYNMLAIPYGEMRIATIQNGSGVWITTSKQMADAFAKALSVQLGESLYDIQILPYCPVQELITGDNTIDLPLISANSKYYQNIVKDSTAVGVVFNVLNNTFTFDIEKKIIINRDSTSTNEVLSDTNGESITEIRVGQSNNPTPVSGTIEIDKSDFEINQDLDVIDIDVVWDGGVSWSLTEGRTMSNWSATFFGNVITYSGIVSSGDDCELTISLQMAADITYKLINYNNSLAVDYKTSDACDVYRLNSPNFSSSFEMSVAKNAGSIEYFNVDCTYKPYSPYIHINPNFKGLYGQDFNDTRGLVLSGDFSYGQITSAWANYELNNKNYQDIFNREISNMDVNNSIAKKEAGFQLVAGGVQQTIQGAVGGALITGSPWGAVAGGVIGATTGTAGGILDWQNLNKRIDEARSYKFDMYGYQLGNIKAQPYTMTKSNAFTANYKQFPFIEYYTCTDIEKNAFRNKLKYNGMTVMMVGKIADYLQGEESYIQATAIRLNDLSEDSYVASEIANEMKRGLYIK